jgi:hypothetical protein
MFLPPEEAIMATRKPNRWDSLLGDKPTHEKCSIDCQRILLDISRHGIDDFNACLVPTLGTLFGSDLRLSAKGEQLYV